MAESPKVFEITWLDLSSPVENLILVLSYKLNLISKAIDEFAFGLEYAVLICNKTYKYRKFDITKFLHLLDKC